MHMVVLSKWFVFSFITAISSVLCAGDMAPFEYYKAEIQHKASGVYDFGDMMFVQSKSPVVSNRIKDKTKSKVEATLGINSELRKWAIDYTAKDRQTKEDLSDGARFVKNVLDQVAPGWQFPQWSVNISVRTIMDKVCDGYYIVAIVADKKAFVDAIPMSYRSPCPVERIVELLPKIVRRSIKHSNADSFYAICGACDFTSTRGKNVEADNEFTEVNIQLQDYIANSELCKELANEAAQLSVPFVVTNNSCVINEQHTLSTQRVEVVSITRYPRMQKLFLDYETETNFPTARLESGDVAVKAAWDQKKTVDEQLVALRRALGDSPGDKELWNLFGRILMKKGDNLGAVLAFRNSLKLDNGFVYPMVNLATAYKVIGKKNLSYGLAMIAWSLANDQWSNNESKKLIGEPVRGPVENNNNKPSDMSLNKDNNEEPMTAETIDITAQEHIDIRSQIK